MEVLQRYGNWEEVKRLGRGTYGEVTLWRNTANKQRVAVKKCAQFKNDPPEKKQKIKERWKNEFLISKSNMKNNNLVEAVDVEPEFLEYLNTSNPSNLPALVMEYCDGGDLRQLLNDIGNSNGMVEYEVKNILGALCNAISYLHGKGIGHRDLKPENIVIKKENDNNIYKITDFGYAKDMIDTAINSQVGTVGYFAPEVMMSGSYSLTCDYWSIGIIAFEIICGFRPFIPHQSPPKWAEELKRKKRSTLAITETNNGQFIHHQKIFNENQISNCLKRTIEETWLPVALDFDYHRSIPAQQNGVPDAVHRSFFQSMEESLAKNTLTVFCLTTYKFLSYEVTVETSLDDLLSEIVKDTNIPEKKLFIILTPEQDSKNMNKPINLILDRAKGPMIYVTEAPTSRPSVETKPYIPEIIEDFMSKSNVLRVFYLLQLVRHIVFFRRNENKHYVAYLTGLKNYGMRLNHTISTQQKKIKQMMADINQLVGFQMHFELMLQHYKEQLEEKNVAHLYTDVLANWEIIEQKSTEDVGQLRNICGKIETRYDSVLRRSKEILDSTLLEETEKDFFNVACIEEFYSNLRQKLSGEKNSHKNYPNNTLLDLISETLLRRSKLLESKDLQCIQINLGFIHDEFVNIIDTLSKAFVQLEIFNKKLREQTRLQQNKFFQIIEHIAIENHKKNQENLPDLDSIMSSLNIDKNTNGTSTIHFQLDSNKISSLTGMDISCFGEGNDARSLTQESDQIIATLHHLSHDIEMSISMLKCPQEGDFTCDSMS